MGSLPTGRVRRTNLGLPVGGTSTARTVSVVTEVESRGPFEGPEVSEWTEREVWVEEIKREGKGPVLGPVEEEYDPRSEPGTGERRDRGR